MIFLELPVAEFGDKPSFELFNLAHVVSARPAVGEDADDYSFIEGEGQGGCRRIALSYQVLVRAIVTGGGRVILGS